MNPNNHPVRVRDYWLFGLLAEGSTTLLAAFTFQSSRGLMTTLVGEFSQKNNTSEYVTFEGVAKFGCLVAHHSVEFTVWKNTELY